MTDFLQSLVPGFADGSIYALCALGLVLTFKTTGVFNFAHGALAAASAYVFYDFHVKQGHSAAVSFVAALVLVGVIGGLILERLALALQSAPPVSVVVATVGLLVLLQSACTARYGQATLNLDEFLPTSGFTLGRVNVSYGQVMVLVGTIAAAVGLYLFFGRTRTGKAMTAVVDDPTLLSLLATNPASIRRYAWILGSCFTSISGILLAPKLGVSVNSLILLVIAAYGAAAIGLFENLPMTVLGAFGIGILVAELPNLTDKSQTPIIYQLPTNLPFLVLFATLLVVPSYKFTQRGARNVRRFRPVRTFSRPVTSGTMVLGLVALVLLPHVIDETQTVQYTSMLAYTIVFASLGLITWTSGQISLCHLGFAAIGATTTGHLLGHGVPWALALLAGGLVTIPAAAIVAIPAIRLSGIYVAVATFGFGILLQQLVYGTFLMFGRNNLVSVPRPQILGIDFTSDRAFYYLALTVTVLSCALVLVVRRSRLGLLLRALSDSPDALDAHGTNTDVTKVLVFCISSFLAAIGGGVLAGATATASSATGGTFDYTKSLVLVAVLGFCGRRPIFAPFLAAFLFQVVKTYPGFSDPGVLKYQGVVFGALAIFAMIAPGLHLGRLGKRTHEREGRTPITSRHDPEPVTTMRARQLELAGRA